MVFFFRLNNFKKSRNSVSTLSNRAAATCQKVSVTLGMLSATLSGFSGTGKPCAYSVVSNASQTQVKFNQTILIFNLVEFPKTLSYKKILYLSCAWPSWRDCIRFFARM